LGLEGPVYRADRLWCNEAQVPAAFLVQIGAKESVAFGIARLRVGSALATAFEILGYFLITLGLFPGYSLWWLSLGVVSKLGGGLTGSVLQNKSGIVWSCELQRFLSRLTAHSQEVGALLSNVGVSQDEIRALAALPGEVYQAELNSYSRSAALTLGAPLGCGIALLLNGEWITGLIVILLGLLSIPLGERYFKPRAFRNEERIRLGRSADSQSYVQRSLRDHMGLTFQVNALSQVPLLLFAIRFLANGFGQLLGSFYALMQGLVGLSGALAFQRSRTVARRATRTTRHLIESVANSSLIVTASSWEEHCRRSPSRVLPDIGIEEGVMLTDFQPILMSRGQESTLNIAPLNCSISAGDACLIQAPSGTGKSTLLMALMHLVDHRGDIYLVRKGRGTNVHDLRRDQLEAAIYFLRETDIGDHLRIVDLFGGILRRRLSVVHGEIAKAFGGELADLAWQAEDSLVEQLIAQMEKGRASVFPLAMLDLLSKMREVRVAEVSDLLKWAKGNLATDRIVPERVFGTLSSGEKKRLMALLAQQEAVTCEDVRLVVLDEPLAHLDDASINDQLLVIQAIQQLPNPPAILIISHAHIRRLVDSLDVKSPILTLTL
jgi:ABC-type cobalamin/Fe3+-siderophores transport system ATPase subunit